VCSVPFHHDHHHLFLAAAPTVNRKLHRHSRRPEISLQPGSWGVDQISAWRSSMRARRYCERQQIHSPPLCYAMHPQLRICCTVRSTNQDLYTMSLQGPSSRHEIRVRPERCACWIAPLLCLMHVRDNEPAADTELQLYQFRYICAVTTIHRPQVAKTWLEGAGAP